MFNTNSTKTEVFFQKVLKDLELSEESKSLLLNISIFLVDELKADKTAIKRFHVAFTNLKMAFNNIN